MIRDRPLPHEGLVISVEPGGAICDFGRWRAITIIPHIHMNAVHGNVEIGFVVRV